MDQKKKHFNENFNFLFNYPFKFESLNEFSTIAHYIIFRFNLKDNILKHILVFEQ